MSNYNTIDFDSLACDRDKWRQKNRYYHNSIRKIYKFFIPKKQSVIEAGCSTGELLAQISPKRGIGIDISKTAIDLANRKFAENNNLNFIHADAETFHSNDKFDYVILSDTIGYLNDIQNTFENLRKLMTARSRLVINFYNFVWEPIFRLAKMLGLKQKEPSQNWLSNADMINLLELAGYEIIHREGFMILPVYIPIISDILNGFFAKLPIIKHFTVAQFIVARPIFHIDGNYSPAVSVIVPARNEAGNIEAAARKIPKLGSKTEIIFVEGGSSDNTWEEIRRVKNLFPDKIIKTAQQDGKGKADAVRKGFEIAQNEILMILDADLTVPPEELIKFYNAIAKNKGEFINGVRLVYPREKEAMRLLNLYGNKFFSLIFSYILGQNYKDTLCGTKVLRKSDYEKIAANRKYFGNFDPYGDFDLIFGAAKLCLKTTQIPVKYKSRTYGETNISRFSGGWLLLKMAWLGFINFKWKLK